MSKIYTSGLLIPVFLLLSACATTTTENNKHAPASGDVASKTAKSPSVKKGGQATQASSEEAAISEPKRNTPKTTGNVKIITTSLVNNGDLDSSVPDNMLTEVIMGIGDIAQKELDNIPLQVTYIGLLRLYGQNPSLLAEVERRAGTFASKDIWYLIESAYSAMSRKDFAFADYLLDKGLLSIEEAKKKGTEAPMARAALSHAVGVRLFLDGKILDAMQKMREKEADSPFLPSLLTVGFLSLRAGDYEGAEKTFRKAAALASSSINARMGLAISLRVRGKTADSIAIWQGLYRSKANDRRITWNYALALSDGDTIQKKQAMALLDKYFQLSGSYPEIDAKANALQNKLSAMQMAVPVAAPAATGAAKTPAAAPAH